MNKILGIIAISTVLSLVLLGCSQPQEGDTSTAPATKPATTGSTASTTATTATTPATTPGTTK